MVSLNRLTRSAVGADLSRPSPIYRPFHILISNYIFPVYFYRARHTCSELDENTQKENILCQMKKTRRSFKSGWIKSSIQETYLTKARHTNSLLLISSATSQVNLPSRVLKPIGNSDLFTSPLSPICGSLPKI